MSDTITIHGRLDADEPTSFSSYTVVAEFDRKLGPETIADRAGSQAARDGTFSVELHTPEEIGSSLTLTALGPQGEPVGETSIPTRSVGDPTIIEITVFRAPEVEPNTDPTLGTRRQYTGRVLDTTGAGYPAGHQVLFWAQAAPDGPFAPLAVAVTRSAGYFSGPWVPGEYAAIEATVADGEAISVPLADGAMPTTVLLVTDPPDVEQGDSDECGASPDVPRHLEQGDLIADAATFAQDPGTCVTFTTPDRTIDETTYFAVVRTTQPMLKARTPVEDRVIPQTMIQRLARTVLDRPTRRTPGRPQAPTSDDGPGAPNYEPAPGGGPIDLDPVGADPSPSGQLPEVVGSTRSADVLRAAHNAARRYAPGIELDDDWLSPTAVRSADQVLEDRLENGIPLELDASVAAEIIRNPTSVTPRDLLRAEHISVVRRFRRAVRLLARPFVSRFTLEPDTQIAWDEIPDGYQATGVAHGHLLTLKQAYRADGYSIGSPLYSLPLAPGQQKLISILDWNRTEVASRRAGRTVTEDLTADLSHDRDISETIDSVLSETMAATSSARTSGFAAGLGGFVGPIVFGGGYAGSKASSEAQQSSSRELSANTMNQLRDRTHQAASAVRSQRSSVVQVSRQGESVQAQTEVIANYNHCHSMTVHYFEVLRHLQVTHELAAAQECLLVPLMMSEFTEAKALRWQRELARGLRRRSLRSAFRSLERVSTNWEDADVPDGRHADEPVLDLEGELWLDVQLPRPADDSNGAYEATAWTAYAGHFSDTEDIWNRYLGVALEEDRDAIWDERLAPIVIQSMLDDLWLHVNTPYVPSSPTRVFVPVDATMVGVYRPGRSLLATFRALMPIPEFDRAEIESVDFELSTAQLPTGGSIVIDSGTMRYRTPYLSAALFENRRIHNDISLGDSVMIPTPLSKIEKRNPREVDQRRADQLLEHLDEHTEYYHRAIWMTMDPNRRYMMLDGVIAPHADGRSVASVVENRVIGVVGNSLVMPVAPGVKLDPTYDFADDTPEDLRHLYAAEPPPPIRLSFPTSGVYAEAVMGSCNTCEVIDDTRFWRFEDAPIPDSPTPIDALGMGSRRTTPPTLAPDTFAEPLVGYQQVPDAPDPTGMAAALDAIGVGDIFKDLTGLALNQANSASALEATMSAAQGFASNGGALAQQRYLAGEVDRAVDLIGGAEISTEAKQGFTKALFQGAIGLAAPASGVPALTGTAVVQSALEQLIASGQGAATQTGPDGSATVALGEDSGETTGGSD